MVTITTVAAAAVRNATGEVAPGPEGSLTDVLGEVALAGLLRDISGQTDEYHFTITALDGDYAGEQFTVDGPDDLAFVEMILG